ncbi:MAG: DinB family protein [Acidobacteriota bacterium]|nr:DinB family protein [Acidobacteriota bacterium]
MNEYRDRLLGLLGSQDPFAVLEATPRRAVDLHAQLGDWRISQPWASGKWTAREVFAHLADVEQGIGFRVRQIVTSPPGHVIQPFDQDLWAKPYRRLASRAAVRALVAMRAWNLSYFRTLEPRDMARAGLHPERGEESVETIIRMAAGHDLNHLAQLDTIAAIPEPVVPDEDD